MVGAPEVETKRESRKAKRRSTRAHTKRCGFRVRTPLFREVCRFAVEVDYLMPYLRAKPVPNSIFV
jgi:hypothetical protein